MHRVALDIAVFDRKGAQIGENVQFKKSFVCFLFNFNALFLSDHLSGYEQPIQDAILFRIGV